MRGESVLFLMGRFGRTRNLCFGNAIGLGVALELNDAEIADRLPKLLADYAATAVRADAERFKKSIQRARARSHFTSAPEKSSP